MVLQGAWGVWQLLVSFPLTPFTYHIIGCANADAGRRSSTLQAGKKKLVSQMRYFDLMASPSF
jgi:hypothetical protein